MNEVVVTKKHIGCKADEHEGIMPVENARMIIAHTARVDEDKVSQNLQKIVDGDEDVRTVYTVERLEFQWIVAPVNRVFRVRTEVLCDKDLDAKTDFALYSFEEGLTLLSAHLGVAKEAVRKMVLASGNKTKWHASYSDEHGDGGIQFEYSFTG